MNSKVLHIVSVSFSLKYFVGNQFIYFKSKGYDFTVACSPSRDFFNYANEMGFNTFPIIISRNISPIQDILSIYKLYKFIKKEKFDVVVAHSPKGGLIGMIAGFLAKTPRRIFFRHGLVFETSSGLKKKMLIVIEKITGFCSHKVVNVSFSIEKVSNSLHLNSVSKNVILGKGSCNGVNIDYYKFKPKSEYKDKFVIGFIGRLCNDKGINELVNAIEYLDEYENIVLLLIGPLDERDVLARGTLQKIEDNPKIIYIGEVKSTGYYYNQMDVFILPSFREGFPTVNLEASASKLPIITTKKTGCIDSIIENQTGIFTENDPEQIAKSIEYYIKNTELRKLHGINGREFVEANFSENVIYRDIESKILTFKD